MIIRSWVEDENKSRSYSVWFNKKSFQPLLEKYNNREQNPATKSLEYLIAEINHPTSETYLFKKEDNYIGYIRVIKREENEYSINDFGYSSHALYISCFEKIFPIQE